MYTCVSLRAPFVLTNLLPRAMSYSLREREDTPGLPRDTGSLQPGQEKEIYSLRYHGRPLLSVRPEGFQASKLVEIGPGPRALEPRYAPVELESNLSAELGLAAGASFRSSAGAAASSSTLVSGASASLAPPHPMAPHAQSKARFVVETSAGGGADEFEAAEALELVRGSALPARGSSFARDRAVLAGKQPKDRVEPSVARLRVCVWATHWLVDRTGAGLNCGIAMPSMPAAMRAPGEINNAPGRPPEAILPVPEAHGLVPVFYAENQRYSPLSFGASGWSSGNLLGTDPRPLTDLTGRFETRREVLNSLPHGYRWATDWKLICEHAEARDGWDYAFNWPEFDTATRPFGFRAAATDFVRRRRWVRLRALDAAADAPEHPVVAWPSRAEIQAACDSASGSASGSASAGAHADSSGVPVSAVFPYGNAMLFTPSETSASAQRVFARLGAGYWTGPLPATQPSLQSIKLQSARTISVAVRGMPTTTHGALHVVQSVTQAPAPFDRTSLVSFDSSVWLANATPFRIMYKHTGRDAAFGLASGPGRDLASGAAVPLHQDGPRLSVREMMVSVCPVLPSGLSGWSAALPVTRQTEQALPLLVPLRRQPAEASIVPAGSLGHLCRTSIIVATRTLPHPRIRGAVVTVLSVANPLPRSPMEGLLPSSLPGGGGGEADAEEYEDATGSALVAAAPDDVADTRLDRGVWLVRNRSSRLALLCQPPPGRSARPATFIAVAPSETVELGLAGLATEDCTPQLQSLEVCDIPGHDAADTAPSAMDLANAVAASSARAVPAPNVDFFTERATVRVTSPAGATVVGLLSAVGHQRLLTLFDAGTPELMEAHRAVDKPSEGWGLLRRLGLSLEAWDETSLLHVESGTIALIDHRPREALVASVQEVVAGAVVTASAVECSLKVRHYQVDDATHGAPYPVMICPNGRERGWLSREAKEGFKQGLVASTGSADKAKALLDKLVKTQPGAFDGDWALHVHATRSRGDVGLALSSLLLSLQPIRVRLAFTVLDKLYGLWCVANRTLQSSSKRTRIASSAHEAAEGAAPGLVDPDMEFDGCTEPIGTGTPVKDASGRMIDPASLLLVSITADGSSQHSNGMTAEAVQSVLQRVVGASHELGVPETMLHSPSIVATAVREGWSVRSASYSSSSSTPAGSSAAGKTLRLSREWLMSGTVRPADTGRREALQMDASGLGYHGRSGQLLLIGDAPFAVPADELLGCPGTIHQLVTDPRRPRGIALSFGKLEIQKLTFVVDYSLGAGMTGAPVAAASDRGLAHALSDVQPILSSVLRSGISLERATLSISTFAQEDIRGSVAQVSQDIAGHMTESGASSGNILAIMNASGTIIPVSKAVSRIGSRLKGAVASSDNPLRAAAGIGITMAGGVTDTVAGITHVVGGISKLLASGADRVGKAIGNEPSASQASARAAAGRSKPPSNVLSGMRSGVGHAMGGVWDGVTGIVTKPVSGFQEHGVAGLLSGVAKGAAGVVVNPLRGIFRATGSVMEGVSGSMEAVGRFADDDSFVTGLMELRQGRCRVPRPFYGANQVMRAYNETDAEAAIRLAAAVATASDDAEMVRFIVGGAAVGGEDGSARSAMLEVLAGTYAKTATDASSDSPVALVMASAEELLELSVPTELSASRITRCVDWRSVAAIAAKKHGHGLFSLVATTVPATTALPTSAEVETGVETTFRVNLASSADPAAEMRAILSRARQIWHEQTQDRRG
jgi:vacuolar protein sorting-associated protein 13A/C